MVIENQLFRRIAMQKEALTPMKRLISLLSALALVLSLTCSAGLAVVIPNDGVLFTADTPQAAMEQIEARFHIRVTDQTKNGISMDVLHNLETALNYLSFDLFQELADHFRTRYSAVLEIIYTDYDGQNYAGLTSLTYDGRRGECSIELVMTSNRFTSSGADVDTTVHELAHLLNYAMLDLRGNNPAEGIFLSANNGLPYRDGYYSASTPWSEYVAELGGTSRHYFVSNYAMTNVYEDFACLLQEVAGDSDAWETALLQPENRPLLTKYRGAVSLMSSCFTSHSPLADLLPSAWAVEDWQAARSLGLVPAELDHAYTVPITRLEFSRLMTALLSAFWEEDAAAHLTMQGYDLTQYSYTDCEDPSVLLLTALGVVGGTGNGCFSPDADITRQEAAKMLTLTAQAADPAALTGGSAVTFSDGAFISGWAEEFVQAVAAGGIMNGTGAGNFSPHAAYDHQQSIITAYRLYQYLK